MRLRGNMTIELTDTDSGEVTAVTEENMVTEAVNNILGENPLGVFYKTDTGYNDMDWSENLLPICPNMIGGILLFSNTLEERTDNIYSLSDNLPVAYASNDVNTTTNLARGSMNLNESKALENGYRFVWEFTATQGNGTIVSVALTSARGGENAYGSDVGDSSTFLQLKSLSIRDLSHEDLLLLFMAVEVEFEQDMFYSLAYQGTGVRIRKVHLPIFTLGLNETLNDSTHSILEDKVLQPESFRFLGSSTLYGEFMDEGDGFWYGFANQDNSSGDAVILWIKILKADYSFTEGSWSLSNAKLISVGGRRENGTYPERSIRCCLRKGYLYVMAYDKTGVYKINVNNPSDITLIPLGFTSSWRPIGATGSCELHMTMVGDLIIGYDFQITVNDKVIQTQGTVRLVSTATPLFQYKNFLLGWGGSYGNKYRTMYLLTPYLATINNLSSAVVKTADKTMKITYTLTEEA